MSLLLKNLPFLISIDRVSKPEIISILAEVSKTLILKIHFFLVLGGNQLQSNFLDLVLNLIFFFYIFKQLLLFQINR